MVLGDDVREWADISLIKVMPHSINLLTTGLPCGLGKHAGVNLKLGEGAAAWLREQVWHWTPKPTYSYFMGISVGIRHLPGPQPFAGVLLVQGRGQ